MPAPTTTELLSAGFSAQEIDTWRAEQRRKLVSAGFDYSEIDAYLGPDLPRTPYSNAGLRAIFGDLKNVDVAIPKEQREAYRQLLEGEPRPDDLRARYAVSLYLAGRTRDHLSPQQVMEQYDFASSAYFGEDAGGGPSAHYAKLREALAPKPAKKLLQQAAQVYMGSKASTHPQPGAELVALLHTRDEKRFNAMYREALANAETVKSLDQRQGEERDAQKRLRDSYADAMRGGLVDLAAVAETGARRLGKILEESVKAVNRRRGAALFGLHVMFQDREDFYKTALTGTRTQQDKATEELYAVLRQCDQIANSDAFRDMGWIEKNFVGAVAQSAYEMLTCYLLGGAVFGPIPYFAASKTGEMYYEFRASGINPAIAQPAAIIGGGIYGAIEGAADVFGMPAGISTMNDRSVRTVVKAILGEWAEEGAQALDENMVVKWATQLNNQLYGGKAPTDQYADTYPHNRFL